MRLVEWNQLELFLRGEKIQAIVLEQIRARRIPIEELRLSFGKDRLVVEGKARKGIAVPFSFTVPAIETRGTTLTIPLTQMSAFGFLPLPAFLFKLLEGHVSTREVAIDGQRNAIIISLDRFLPDFLDVTIESIHIVPGGLALRLGGGGADLPLKEASDGTH